jgi:hypothetical protein
MGLIRAGLCEAIRIARFLRRTAMDPLSSAKFCHVTLNEPMIHRQVEA